MPGLVLLLALASACGGREGSAEPVTARDSAGVTVVENGPAAEASAPRWRLAETPDRVLGGEGPASTLLGVVDVRPLGDGRVLVADGRAQEVVVFGPDGALVARHGGRGDGPGEFRRLSDAVLAADGAVAGFESLERRFTVFDEEGAVAHEAVLEGDLPTWVLGDLLEAPDGWVFFGRAGVHAGMAPVDRADVPSLRYDREGHVVARYGPFPGDAMSAGNDLGAVMFGARLRGAVAGDRLVVGDSDHAEVRAYAPDGSLERIVRWPAEARAVTDAMAARWAEATAAIAPPERRAQVARRLQEIMPRADVVPMLDAVLGLEDGSFWVGRYREPEGGAPRSGPKAMAWRVFGPDGRLLARLDTPDGFDVKVVRDGLVWGVHRDELDRETVRAYGVVEG